MQATTSARTTSPEYIYRTLADFAESVTMAGKSIPQLLRETIQLAAEALEAEALDDKLPEAHRQAAARYALAMRAHWAGSVLLDAERERYNLATVPLDPGAN